MDPDRLPVSEDDLGEWSVYADYLLTRGDPRGELLALELSLPASLDRAQVAAFHAVARRQYRRSLATPMTWCLGHIRTLDIPSLRLRAVGAAFDGPSPSQLTRVRDLLRSPAGRLVERLSISYEPQAWRAHWRRLFAALPPTCQTVCVGMRMFDPRPAAMEDLIAMLPPHVRTLELMLAAPYRPDVAVSAVAMRGPFDAVVLHTADPALLQRLSEVATAATIHVLAISRDRPLLGWVLGREGDAAVASDTTARVLARPSWLELQDRFGPMPIRTQLARVLPEKYLPSPRWEGYDHASLVRRGDAWSFQQHEGEPTTNVRDGDRFGDQTLITRDLDRRCRALLG